MKNPKTHPALEVLSHYKSLVWPEVQKYITQPEFPELFKIPSTYEEFIQSAHWNMIKDYPERRGKYVRASIIMLVVEALGENSQSALKTAAAMQLSEDWILIHDDLEDNSKSRRGKPALHRIYGNELAINAGDGLHNIMWKALADNIEILGANKAKLIMDEFYIMLTRTVLGQTVEMSWTKDLNKIVGDDEWFFIADGKTGYYTMAGPARLGGIIAGANSQMLDHLTEFGFYLGRCFQLIDDILDVTSNFAGLKEMGNDIYEGKRTLLLGHLMKNIDKGSAKRLHSILLKAREDKSEKEVLWVIEKMKQTGSIEYATLIANQYKEQALRVFEEKLNFLNNEPARSNIKKLTEFIAQRDH